MSLPEPITRQDFLNGFRHLGLYAGAGVMVHSSLKSFGRVAGGPQTVIDALQAVLTPEGTLLLPTFNHGVAFEEGMPGYYHPEKTPTINGAIPDTFWKLPGVKRSLDPTHPFAAWGKNAQAFTQDHHRTLTMGPKSPLGLLCEQGGFGLLLGVSYAANTFHHVVEMSTGAPCLGLRSEVYPVALPGGRMVQGRTWGWRAESCPINDHSLYQEQMLALQREVLIGTSRVICFRLQDCYAVIANLLREGVNGFPPCSQCTVRPRFVPQTVPSDWDSVRERIMPDSVAWTY